MKEFETQIIITNALKYEKLGIKGVRVTYLLTEPELCKNNDNFTGCVEVSEYYNDHAVFEKIRDNKLILVPLKAKFKVNQDYKNPLKYTNKLESVEYKGNVTSLL